MNISILGLGYVGLSLALAFAEKNFCVSCFDRDYKKLKNLQNNKFNIYEPFFDEVFKRNRERLIFTDELDKSDMYFICVNTPSLANGRCDISHIKECINSIIKIDKINPIIIKSTCEVGTCRKMQNYIYKKKAKNSIVFSPEFLSQGSAYHDTLNPDRIVLGGQDKQLLLNLKKMLKIFSNKIYIMNWESAEIVKYASNCILATKISTINEISNLCEEVGAEISDVSRAVGADKRIGKYFLKAGCGFGGSCFEKDLKAFIYLSKSYNIPQRIFKSTLEANNNQRLLVTKKLKNEIGNLYGKTIAVLGLAFKENTNDARESVALYVVNDLLRHGAQIKLYDPQAINSFKYEYEKKFDINLPKDCFFNSIKAVSKNVNGCIVLTAWQEFANLKSDDLKNIPIIDGRNCLKNLPAIGFGTSKNN